MRLEYFNNIFDLLELRPGEKGISIPLAPQ
jgi:hypothetical protein